MIFYFYTLNIWRVILHLLSEIVLLQAANLTCDTAYSMHQILPLNLFQNRGRESIGEMEEGTGNPRPKCQYSASAGRKITRPKYYQGYYSAPDKTFYHEMPAKSSSSNSGYRPQIQERRTYTGIPITRLRQYKWNTIHGQHRDSLPR